MRCASLRSARTPGHASSRSAERCAGTTQPSPAHDRSASARAPRPLSLIFPQFVLTWALVLAEPLSPPAAKALILDILANGEVTFSNHALDEMGKEDPDITEEESFAVLRGGIVEPAEFRSGSWRYRVRAMGVYVVIAFRSETRAKVVTAWRVRR